MNKQTLRKPRALNLYTVGTHSVHAAVAVGTGVASRAPLLHLFLLLSPDLLFPQVAWTRPQWAQCSTCPTPIGWARRR